MMGEADFPRVRGTPAADQPRLGRRMMRRAEGPLGHESALAGQESAYAPHARDLDGLVEGERRHDAGQTPGQHCLAGPRRPDHQHVMSAAGRDFHGALGVGVTPNVGKVQTVPGWRRQPAPRIDRDRLDDALGVQVLDGVVNGAHWDHFHPADHGGFGGVVPRDEQRREACPPAMERDREHPSHRLHGAFERHLAEHDGALDEAGLDDPRRAQKAEGDRKVEGGPFFPDVCRRQVDGDTLHREIEARVPDGSSDPVATLADDRIGKTDGGEGGQTRGDVDLDPDHGGLDAVNGCRAHSREHEGSVRSTVAGVNASKMIHVARLHPDAEESLRACLVQERRG